MEFKFKLTDFFKKPITRIDNSLIPEGFRGDRRTLSHCVQTVSELIDRMGIASAKAQGLQKPITTADKLRNSEQTLYLLIDPEDNRGHGSVVGLLKVGRKKLYVFDCQGECHYDLCLCVLDFYVHESRQRQGCGKTLFEHMLEVEKIDPEKLAIDRPSDKFLSFLSRHYGLENIVPQNNNFVVFMGFFSSKSAVPSDNSRILGTTNKYLTTSHQTSSRSSNSPISYNGRHAAHKPETTIGKCLSWCPSAARRPRSWPLRHNLPLL